MALAQQIIPGHAQWWRALLEMLQEPILLLITITIIYFISEQREHFYAAYLIISGISFTRTTAPAGIEGAGKISNPDEVIRIATGQHSHPRYSDGRYDHGGGR